MLRDLNHIVGCFLFSNNVKNQQVNTQRILYCIVKYPIITISQAVSKSNYDANIFSIDGYIIYTDTTDIKAFTAELSAIGRNINQIAKRINATGSPYQADMEEIRERLDQIWQLQRRILSSQR